MSTSLRSLLLLAVASAVASAAACGVTVPNETRESAFGPGSSCPLSRADCDGDPSNGCETDTDLALAHCGGCSRTCSTNHATSRCTAGFCRLSCAAGYADCNGRAEDGCESLLAEDGQNCGACGKRCGGGGCNQGVCGGRPTLVATGLLAPGTLAADGERLFVGGQGTSANDFTDGQIVTLLPDGGDQAVLASNVRAPVGLAVEGGRPVWTYPGTELNGYLDGTVSTLRADGGVQVLAGAQRGATGVDIEDGGVFWVNTEFGSVATVDLDGGPTAVWVSSLPLPISVTASSRGVFVSLLGAAEDEGLLLQVFEDGGFSSLADGQRLPYAIASDDAALYWLNRGTSDAGFENGAIVRLPLDGGAATVLADGERDPTALYVDDTGVYWTSLTHGTVKRVAKDGTGETQLASGFFGPSAVVVVGDAVFFTVFGDGTLRAIARP